MNEPQSAVDVRSALPQLKPRTLGIMMTTKEEDELRDYLDTITWDDEEMRYPTPQIVLDILEALKQAEGGKTVDYEGGECASDPDTAPTE